MLPPAEASPPLAGVRAYPFAAEDCFTPETSALAAATLAEGPWFVGDTRRTWTGPASCAFVSPRDLAGALFVDVDGDGHEDALAQVRVLARWAARYVEAERPSTSLRANGQGRNDPDPSDSVWRTRAAEGSDLHALCSRLPRIPQHRPEKARNTLERASLRGTACNFVDPSRCS